MITTAQMYSWLLSAWNTLPTTKTNGSSQGTFDSGRISWTASDFWNGQTLSGVQVRLLYNFPLPTLFDR